MSIEDEVAFNKWYDISGGKSMVFDSPLPLMAMIRQVAKDSWIASRTKLDKQNEIRKPKWMD